MAFSATRAVRYSRLRSVASRGNRKISDTGNTRIDLVSDFLRLIACEDRVPAATIADVLLFATGAKPSLRFAVPSQVREKLDTWASKHGLHGAFETVGCTRVGDWVCVSRHYAAAVDSIDVTAYATTSVDAAAVCSAEHDRPGVGAGPLLGYPNCCVEAYREYQLDPENWILSALSRSGAPPYPCWANRLPISWGAPTFVGELYPCAFDCPHAVQIGKLAYDAMKAMGLLSLAERTLAETLRPVPHTLPADDAAFSIANSRHFGKLEFTQ